MEAIKYGAENHGSQMMYPSDVGDPLTFPPGLGLKYLNIIPVKHLHS